MKFLPSSEMKSPKSVKKYYYRGSVCWQHARLDEQFFRALSKYFSGKDGSSPLEKLARTPMSTFISHQFCWCCFCVLHSNVDPTCVLMPAIVTNIVELMCKMQYNNKVLFLFFVQCSKSIGHISP